LKLPCKLPCLTRSAHTLLFLIVWWRGCENRFVAGVFSVPAVSRAPPHLGDRGSLKVGQ
jgi:hypothetical protein